MTPDHVVAGWSTPIRFSGRARSQLSDIFDLMKVGEIALGPLPRFNFGDQDDLREFAELCAWQSYGYRVPVEPGTELDVIKARIAELDRCCASYSRALRNMHLRIQGG